MIVLSTHEEILGENAELVKAMGFENDDSQETVDYFESGGDYWMCDPDYVIHDGIKLSFGTYDNFLLIDFDPVEYPEHLELIQRWNGIYGELGYMEINDEFYRANEAHSADSCIAYRGGSGYTYGIFVPFDRNELRTHLVFNNSYVQEVPINASLPAIKAGAVCICDEHNNVPFAVNGKHHWGVCVRRASE